ncbi:MAG: hypothetical protein JO189_30145 [Deltaproteobacteria bacterium]|nr:hypothetical protein [Deltaproteobacteria bacterium]
MRLGKWKMILPTLTPLLLCAGAAWCATSGWGVDAPLTSAGTMIQTSGAYAIGLTALAGMGAGLAFKHDWHGALYGGMGGVAGAGLMTNANATLGVVGSSPGVLLHGLPHVMTFATLLHRLLA